MKTSSSAPASTPDRAHAGQAEPRGNSFCDALLRHLSPTATAVMVDAAFFLKRAKRVFGKLLPQQAANPATPSAPA